jgi:hypothetical protein
MIKNNYIHTTTPKVSKLNEPYQKPIYDHAQTCLISLIHALGSKNFDSSKITMEGKMLPDTLKKTFLYELSNYKEKYLQNSSPFILDSGGYSIIAGDVPAIETNRFISCYIDALAGLKDVYDYVFSLDIPIFLNEPAENTKEKIYGHNKMSLSRSIKVIEEHPDIGDKFSMVLQWKTPKQYNIWDSLYDELHLKEYVKQYAVGGLVGLLGLCPHINFAPFIGACYYWLHRYIERGDFSRPLFIHILGQYHKSSRFIMFFIQHLFTYYLKEYNQTCIITYDTINYSISSMFKTRVGVDVHYFEDNGDFRIVHSYELNNEILSRIYTTELSLKKFHENWDTIKNDELLIDTSFLIPTYVYSQLQLDKFYEQFIIKTGLVDLFNVPEQNGNVAYQKFINHAKPILTECKFFNSNFTNSVITSFQEIYQFHYTFTNSGPNKDKLDLLMGNFIQKVKFPFELG